MSLHLDGKPCRVGCEFCYLGARADAEATLDLALLERALARLAYRELAVAVSDIRELDTLARVAAVATERAIPVAVTTTPQLVAIAPAIVDHASRVSLSIDPRKGAVVPARIDALAAQLHARKPGVEVVLIVSLIDERFAAQVLDGLLVELVDLPSVDVVALNALKPPPPWCGRAFFMRALDRLRPLLARALDRRLFLDCWVAARLLSLGECPARADLSPAPSSLAFRACVYQATPDFIAADADSLARRLRGFTAPARCPFEIPA